MFSRIQRLLHHQTVDIVGGCNENGVDFGVFEHLTKVAADILKAKLLCSVCGRNSGTADNRFSIYRFWQ